MGWQHYSLGSTQPAVRFPAKQRDDGSDLGAFAHAIGIFRTIEALAYRVLLGIRGTDLARGGRGGLGSLAFPDIRQGFARNARKARAISGRSSIIRPLVNHNAKTSHRSYMLQRFYAHLKFLAFSHSSSRLPHDTRTVWNSFCLRQKSIASPTLFRP